MSHFEAVADDCANAIQAREVAKLIALAAQLIERACEKANATDKWRITATVETCGVTFDCAQKLAAISADIMHRIRSDAR